MGSFSCSEGDQILLHFFYKTESKGKHLCASITEPNTIHTRDTLTSWSALLHKPIMQSWNYKLRFHFIFFVFINVDWLPILLQISLLDGHCVYKMFGLLIHFHGCGLNWGFIFFIILFLGRIENLYHVVCSCSPICLPPSSCSFCLFVCYWKSPESSECYQYVHHYGAINYGLENLLTVLFSKKNDPATLGSHPLSVTHQLRVRFQGICPFPIENLPGLILCWS